VPENIFICVISVESGSSRSPTGYVRVTRGSGRRAYAKDQQVIA